MVTVRVRVAFATPFCFCFLVTLLAATCTPSRQCA